MFLTFLFSILAYAEKSSSDRSATVAVVKNGLRKKLANLNCEAEKKN